MGLLKARNEQPRTPQGEAPATPEALAAGLGSADPAVRRGAARGLAAHPGTEAVLGAALAGEVQRAVQEALVAALTDLATEQATAVLLSQLRAADPWLRNAVAVGLQEIGPAAAPAVAALLDDADPATRIAANVVLAGLRCPEAAGWIAARLDREADANACAAMVETLDRIGGPDCVPALARLAARAGDDPFLAFAAEAVRARLADAAAP